MANENKPKKDVASEYNLVVTVNNPLIHVLCLKDKQKA